jgi:hypothetical protein
MNSIDLIILTVIIMALIAFGLYYANEKEFFGRFPDQYRKRIKRFDDECSLGSFMFFFEINGKWRSWSDCKYGYRNGIVTITPGLPFGWFMKSIAVPLESMKWNGSRRLYFRRREIFTLEDCDVRIAVPKIVWDKIID